MLRPYQQKTIDLVKAEIRKGKRRILVCLPTGAGKSHVLAGIAGGCVEKGNRVLSIVHRRQLVTQLCEKYNSCGIDSGIIMAGIDSETHKPSQVASLLTYNRRMNLAELAINQFFIDAPVLLWDEGHHCISKTAQKVLNLYNNKIVIAVTATPCLSSGASMGSYFDSLVCPVTVQELIDEGFLVPGSYYGPSAPDLSKIKTVLGDYDRKSLGDAMNTPKLVGDVVSNWVRIASDKKTFCFAVNVKHSKALVLEFQKYGITAEHLDAHSDDEEREAVLTRFRNGETQIVSNVALFLEGTDVQEIEALSIARPTKSNGLHLQLLGRASRTCEGKKEFIVIDHGGNCDRLGFYEDHREWTLDGKKPAMINKTVRKKEKKIIACPMCAHMHTGARCDICTYVIPDFGKKIDAIESDLVELKGKKKEKKYTTEGKRIWYGMFLSEAQRLGKGEKWVLAQYKSKMGVWPRGMESVTPIPASVEVLNWLKYQRIRFVKRMQKQNNQSPLPTITQAERSGVRAGDGMGYIFNTPKNELHEAETI